jgi:hypothetical protein
VTPLYERVARRAALPVRRLAVRRAMRELGYEKVFGIGAARTGTSSLGRALVLLGFRHMSWDPELWERFEAGEYEPIFAVADRFESFEDGPWNGPDFYRALDERFPQSKFVLTVRDTASWATSHERHFSSEGARAIPEEYWIHDYAAKREAIVKDYEERNRAVVEYFARRPDRLLVVDVCAGRGWPELCAFLGLAAPQKPFPHVNRGEAG